MVLVMQFAASGILTASVSNLRQTVIMLRAFFGNVIMQKLLLLTITPPMKYLQRKANNFFQNLTTVFFKQLLFIALFFSPFMNLKYFLKKIALSFILKSRVMSLSD